MSMLIELKDHEVVKVLRNRLGMTQQELAEACGLGRKTITELERGVAINRTMEFVLIKIKNLATAAQVGGMPQG